MSGEPYQIRMYKKREEAHAAQERSLAAEVRRRRLARRAARRR